MEKNKFKLNKEINIDNEKKLMSFITKIKSNLDLCKTKDNFQNSITIYNNNNKHIFNHSIYGFNYIVNEITFFLPEESNYSSLLKKHNFLEIEMKHLYIPIYDKKEYIDKVLEHNNFFTLSISEKFFFILLNQVIFFIDNGDIKYCPIEKIEVDKKISVKFDFLNSKKIDNLNDIFSIITKKYFFEKCIFSSDYRMKLDKNTILYKKNSFLNSLIKYEFKKDMFIDFTKINKQMIFLIDDSEKKVEDKNKLLEEKDISQFDEKDCAGILCSRKQEVIKKKIEYDFFEIIKDCSIKDLIYLEEHEEVLFSFLKQFIENNNFIFDYNSKNLKITLLKYNKFKYDLENTYSKNLIAYLKKIIYKRKSEIYKRKSEICKIKTERYYNLNQINDIYNKEKKIENDFYIQLNEDNNLIKNNILLELQKVVSISEFYNNLEHIINEEKNIFYELTDFFEEIFKEILNKEIKEKKSLFNLSNLNKEIKLYNFIILKNNNLLNIIEYISFRKKESEDIRNNLLLFKIFSCLFPSIKKSRIG